MTIRFAVALVLCVVVGVLTPRTSARFIEVFSDDDAAAVQPADNEVDADDGVVDRRRSRRLPFGTYDFDADENSVDERSFPFRQYRSGSAVAKRSGWAPSEMRVDQLMQKLRSHFYQNRDKHSSSPAAATRRRRSDEAPMTSSSSSSPSSLDLDQLRQLLRQSAAYPGDNNGDVTARLRNPDRHVVDDLLTDLSLLELIRSAGRPDVRAEVAVLQQSSVTGRPEMDVFRSAVAAWGGSGATDDVDEMTGNGAKRAPGPFAGAAEIRSPRDIHPVYLGMGQNAASAALNTYASLLADDKRRENSELPSSNPVRFIGRR